MPPKSSKSKSNNKSQNTGESFDILKKNDTDAWLAKQTSPRDFDTKDLPINQGFRFEPCLSSKAHFVSAATQLLSNTQSNTQISFNVSSINKPTPIHVNQISTSQTNVVAPPPTTASNKATSTSTTSTITDLPASLLEKSIDSAIVKGDPYHATIRKAIINMPDLRPFLLCTYVMEEIKREEGFIYTSKRVKGIGYFNRNTGKIALQPRFENNFSDILSHEVIHCITQWCSTIPGLDFSYYLQRAQNIFLYLENKCMHKFSKEQCAELLEIKDRYFSTEYSHELIAGLSYMRPLLSKIDDVAYKEVEDIYNICLTNLSNYISPNHRAQYDQIISGPMKEAIVPLDVNENRRDQTTYKTKSSKMLIALIRRNSSPGRTDL